MFKQKKVLVLSNAKTEERCIRTFLSYQSEGSNLEEGQAESSTLKKETREPQAANETSLI